MGKLDFFGRVASPSSGGGGTVTGSGTTNYISKWTSSTAQGNSLIYDDGTIVVIGGTSATSTSVGDAQFTLNGTDIGLGHNSGTVYLATYNNGTETTGLITNADDMLIGDGESVNAGIYIYIRQNVGAQTGINITGNLLGIGTVDIRSFRNLTLSGYSDSASYKVGGVAGATGGTYTTITSITVTNGIITAISGS